MDADDASSAEMRRRHADSHADPLALDEETIEQLLTGQLTPAQAPPRYAEVAALLAAMTAEPSPEELAGQSTALAELRAATRPRRADRTRRVARTPRRRWAGLAAVALLGALVTGGTAVAAGGGLPAPVRNIARSMLGAGGGAGPVSPTPSGQQPAAAGPSHTSTSTGPTAGSQGRQPAGTAGHGPEPTAARSPADPDVERLCQTFLAGKGVEQGKRLDATAFQDLAKLAGGAEKIPSYCQKTLAGEAKEKEHGQQPPGGGQGQGQGGPPTSAGADDRGRGEPRTTTS
jgi:hypothetical protein